MLFPAELVELLLGADELHRAVLEKNVASARVVVFEREQFGPAVLVPARTCLEQKHHIRRRIHPTIWIHSVMRLALTCAGTLEVIAPLLVLRTGLVRILQDGIAPAIGSGKPPLSPKR